MLFLDLVTLEGGQVAQTEVDNGLGLLFAQPEPAHEAHLGGLGVLARPDHPDDLVEIGDRDEQAFEDMSALLRLVQLETSAPDYHFFLVGDVVAEDLAERQGLGDTVGQGQHDDAERALHRRVLEELVEHHFRYGFALELDHDTHARAVRLVAEVRDLRYLLLADQLRDLFDELGFVHLVGELGDDDRRLALLEWLAVGAGAYHDPAPAGLVGLADAGMAHDDPRGGEVRAFYVAHQIAAGQRGIVDQGDRRGDGLAQIVGRARWSPCPRRCPNCH